MRAFVFTDKSLERRAGQFVWLAIDTEKAQNAPFKRRFAVDALPTFFVIDPKTETAALRWVGGATVPQLQKILEEGRSAVGSPRRGTEEILARADRLFAQNRNEEAARAYREALAAAPAGWPRFGRVLESLLYALDATQDKEGCARTARDAFSRLSSTPSAANVAATGLACAVSMKKESPGRDELIAALRADALSVARSGRADLAADDVSAVYQALEQERDAAGDTAGKEALLEEHLSFLERQAAAAGTPERRAVFDSHRLGASLELRQPERAISMLEQSEKDAPDDYNPPARLATAFKAMKRWDAAAAASDRALAKAYGPRRIGILQTRADIEAGRGDTAASRRFLEEALRTAESFPEGQRSEKTISALKKKLEPGPAPTPAP
jgi:tetratricopeptide (TPR) repeat protein